MDFDDPEVALPQKTNRSKWRSLLFFLIKFGVAVAILSWLIFQSSVDQMKSLLEISFGTILIVYSLQFFQQVVGAFRWRDLLFIQGAKISFWESLSLNLQSFFFSLVLPGGALGGDIVKGGFLCQRIKKERRLELLSTILIDRILGMIALFGLILAMSIPYLYYFENLTSSVKLLLMILLPACILGMGAGIGLFFHREIVKIVLFNKIVKKIDQLLKGRIQRLFDAFDLYRKAGWKLTFWVVISIFLVHLPACFMVYLLALSLEVHLPIYDFIFATCAGNAASTLPFTIGGFGIREATIEILLRTPGYPSSYSILPVLAYGAVLLFFNLTGGIFYFLPHGVCEDIASSKSPNL